MRPALAGCAAMLPTADAACASNALRLGVVAPSPASPACNASTSAATVPSVDTTLPRHRGDAREQRDARCRG